MTKRFPFLLRAFYSLGRNKLFKSIVLTVFLLFFSPGHGVAAKGIYSLNEKSASAKIELETKHKILDSYIEKQNFILKLDGRVNLEEEEFWGSPLTRVTSEYKEGITNIVFHFINKPAPPDVKLQGSDILIKFDLVAQNKAADSSGSVYLRLFVGLGIILIFILILYFFIRFFSRKNISTDIPGVGRLMGKVDIMPGRNLVFYELDEIIYILGVTGEGISVVDKIIDEDQVSRIKNGFSKKSSFGSYFKFFNKDSVDGDVKISSSIIKDKVDSLRKR